MSDRHIHSRKRRRYRLSVLLLALLMLSSCHVNLRGEVPTSDSTVADTLFSSETSPAPALTTPALTESSIPIFPTTEAPTTEPNRTEPPVTTSPTTTAPSTEPPVTEPPVTEPPVVEPPVVELPDPVLYFDFNRPSGTSFTSSDGRYTGSYYNLTVKDSYDGKGLYTTYKKRCGFSFGKSTVASLCPDGRFTVSMWVRGEETDGKNLRILSLYDEAGEYLGVYYSDTRLYLWMTDHRTNRYDTYIFPYTLAEGGNDEIWQFLTLTVDRNTCEAWLFVNARELMTRQKSSGGNKAGTTLYEDTIGGDGAKSASNMTGGIDNFYLHSGILTAEQIKLLYLSQPNVSDSYDNLLHAEKVEALVELLGGGAILKAGTSNIVHNGYVIKADTENYEVNNLLLDGILHVSASFAARYFGAVILQGNIAAIGQKRVTGILKDGVLYFSLPALCQSQGLATIDLTKESSGLFIICAADTLLTLPTHRVLIEAAEPFCTEKKGEPTINVEQTRKVIMYSDKSTGEWVYSPSILRVGNILYASMDASDGLYTAVFRSLDEGETWEFLSKIEKYYWWASLFEVDGTLYLFGAYSTEWVHSEGKPIRYYIGITRSTDGGYSWEAMTEGNGLISYKNSMPHRAPTACLRHDGKIYFVFEYSALPVLCWAEEASDLMKAESWTFAPFNNQLHDITYAIEGNPILGRDGRIYVLSRTSVANTAFLSVLNESGTALEPIDYVPMDGASHKFTVRYDEVTGKYLSISNYTAGDPAIKQQRLNLVLLSSEDLLHWEIEEFLLADRQVLDWYTAVNRNGFQYVDWIIDGDDILMAVREARENAQNYHDANYLTFYRIDNYAQYID